MKIITIDRRKWLRGRLDSCLWNGHEQKGCCLGHVIHQTTKCKWEALDLLDAPIEFFKKESLLTEPTGVLGDIRNNSLTDTAMGINDDVNITDVEREERLIALFKKYKIKLVFKN